MLIIGDTVVLCSTHSSGELKGTLPGPSIYALTWWALWTGDVSYS